MQENLMAVKLPPGLFHNGTVADAAGRWYTASLMRWVQGVPQSIGGWRVLRDGTATAVALTGVPRGAVSWRSAAGSARMAIGTTSKLYAIDSGSVVDITPAGFTTGASDSVLAGGAFGSGLFGDGDYGSGSSLLTLSEADTWQLDVFGDYLVGVFTADGRVLLWTGDTLTVAVQATGSPTGCRGVVVTPERFLVALGAGGNVRQVKWASQETTDAWTPLSTNTAGDFELPTNGRIMCARPTNRQTLIWTDTDLWSMTHIGGTLVYSFARAGDNCGIIAPNAVAMADSQVFWMGRNGFFTFDGFVRPLPCEVQGHVFGTLGFNEIQAAKVWSMSIAEFGEIWWFYPSGGSDECDAYVVYNHRENHWSFGMLTSFVENNYRTAGFDRGVSATPVMFSKGGAGYEHETGVDYDNTNPYLESGPFELDPDRIVRIQKIVPDGSGNGTINLWTAMLPGGTETFRATLAADVPSNVRLTGRLFRVRVTAPDDIENWTPGIPRFGVLPLGRR